MKQADRRGPFVIVTAGSSKEHQGPTVVFWDRERWVIDLLARWARSRCCNDSLAVFKREGRRWVEWAVA